MPESQAASATALEAILKLLPELLDGEVEDLLRQVIEEGSRRGFGVYWWE